MIKFDKILGNIRTNDVTNTEINLFANSINVTYAELFSLRDEKKLVAGKQYRITDYVTAVANDDEARSAGHRFDLLVIADDDHTINAQARAILHEGDTYFANSELYKWQIWYDIDNDTNKYAWANGDFLSYGDKYGFAGINESADKITAGSPSELTYIKEVSIGGTTYYAWYGGDYGATNGNFYLTNDRFPKYGDALLETDAGFTYVEKGSELTVQKFDDESIIHYAGRGVIYRMIDEHGNDCPYDFKNVLFKRYITQGAFMEDLTFCSGKMFSYLIGRDMNIDDPVEASISDENDYIWCYTFMLTNNLGNRISDASMYNTLFHDDTNMYDNKLCYDNIIQPYSTILTIDKNYYSVVQLNNIVLLCNDYGDHISVYNNTFEDGCYNITLCGDCRDNSFGKNCYKIIIDNGISNKFSKECYAILLGSNCKDNTFFDCCYNIALGEECYYNSFGFYSYLNLLRKRCIANTFKGFCYNITFGDYCCYNTFDLACTQITFTGECLFNSFHNSCYIIIFKTSCSFNTLKNDCNYITLDDYCEHNVFGSSVNSINWGTYYSYNIIECNTSSISFMYNNNIANYIRYVYVTNNTHNINVICPKEPSDTEWCQNIKILSSASGKSSKSPTCCELESLNDTYTTQFGDYKIGAMSVEADEEVQS